MELRASAVTIIGVLRPTPALAQPPQATAAAPAPRDVHLLDDHNNPDPYDATKKLSGARAETSGKKFNKQGVASVVVSGAKGL
jgi:hypothetical protein